MRNFDKLYIHLMIKGIEHYGDSKTVINKIHDILNTSEDELFTELHQAFNQAKRLNILKKHGVPMSIENLGEQIDDTNLPDDILEQLLSEAIDINTLRNVMTKQINNVK